MTSSSDNQRDSHAVPAVQRRCPCGGTMAPLGQDGDSPRSLWDKSDASGRNEYVCSKCGASVRLAAPRTLFLVGLAVALVVLGSIWNRLEPIAWLCVGVAVAVVGGRELALRHHFPRVR